MTVADVNPLYVRQLLGGRDFAVDDPVATQMVNFVYLIGDRSTGECLVVDPAYAVREIIDLAATDGMRITGVAASHYHADHVGGSLFGHDIQGVADLLGIIDVPVHVNENEVPWISRTTGISAEDMVAHSSGDSITVGSVSVECLHTPGHTPGSQCFLVHGCLVSGDTLFLDGCGRTDLPGSDVGDMWESLSSLARLPDDTVVLPGHRYSEPPAARLGDVKSHNYVFRPRTKEQWLMMFGH